eukprot:scaffold10976_cov80-Skeletonema_menzelii.AAC.1
MTFATDDIAVALQADEVNASTKVASMTDEIISATTEMRQQWYDERGDNIVIFCDVVMNIQHTLGRSVE